MNWLIWIIPTHENKREAPSLHDLTSHWLHGNSIPKIGSHYFFGVFEITKLAALFFWFFSTKWEQLVFCSERFKTPEPAIINKFKYLPNTG